MDYRKLFAEVHKRPSLYGLNGTFHDFTVFVRGCEAGNDWQLLSGFRELLVTRFGDGNDLVWEGLVLHLAFSDRSRFPRLAELTADSPLNEIAVSRLFELLDEFLALRTEHGGVAKIFDEYWQWHRGRA